MLREGAELSRRRDQEARQGEPRGLQGPARRRVHGRAAAHLHRQGPQARAADDGLTTVDGAMPQRTDTFDLAPLGLRSGDGRRLDLHVAIDAFHYGGEPYAVEPAARARPRSTSRARPTWAGRCACASAPALRGPCMRCLEPAEPVFDVDAREVSQPGGGEELSSPYVADDEELISRAWARDALALELPGQLTCREDCAGLCGAVRSEPQRGPGAPPRGGARPALGQARRAEVRLADRGGPAGLTDVENPPNLA